MTDLDSTLDHAETQELSENDAPSTAAADPENSAETLRDAELIANGYEPVACDGKAPVGKEWQRRPNTPEAITAERKTRPNATNTGLRTGRLVGVDIDLQDRAHAAQLDRLAAEVLGRNDMQRVGSKGAMLCYRNETPIGKITLSGERDGRRRSLIEILGTGQQFVAYGMHPDTGRDYEWPNAPMCAEPLECPISALPEVTPDTLREFARRAAALLTELGYPGVQISDRGAPGERAALRRQDRAPVPKDYLIAMLAHVPPGCSRIDWIACLAGIQATNLAVVPPEDMDGELVEIAKAWSRGDYCGGQPDNWTGDDDVEFDYDSLTPEKDGGSGFGTLYRVAQQNGWDKSAPGSIDDRSAAEVFGGAAANLSDRATGEDGPDTGKVHLINGAKVKPMKIEWLWRGWLARGKFHVLAGAKGTGKSTLVFDLFATLSVGGPWPDGTTAPCGDVLIWSAEDDLEDTILPRFLASGGDPGRLRFVRHVTSADGAKRHFDPATDMPALLAAARQLPELVAVMVDPVVSAVAADSHKNAEARRGLQPLVDFAAERRVALLGITHFTKNTQGREPVERVTGSLAFAALPRIVWAAAKGSDEEASRRLVRIASNIGEAGGGFEYLLRRDLLPGHENFEAQRVVWGKRLTGSARELLDDGDAKQSQTFKAIGFLNDVLTEAGPDGEFVSDLKQAAQAQSLSWRTVELAKQKMGNVRAKKRPGCTPPKWSWCLDPSSGDELAF